MATLMPPQMRTDIRPLRRTASDGPAPMATMCSESTPQGTSFPTSNVGSMFQIQNDSSDGEELAARYQMLEELGSGSFGVVYKAIEKATGEVVAVKHVCFPRGLLRINADYLLRSILSPLKRISAIFCQSWLSLAPALQHMSPNTNRPSCASKPCGL